MSPTSPPDRDEQTPSPPQKRAGWMNVYHGVRLMPVFPTRKDADEAAWSMPGLHRIACVYVAECEEPK